VTVNAVKHLFATALLLKPATRPFIFAWLAWAKPPEPPTIEPGSKRNCSKANVTVPTRLGLATGLRQASTPMDSKPASERTREKLKGLLDGQGGTERGALSAGASCRALDDRSAAAPRPFLGIC
jgi:hypothetical protein